MRIECLLTGAEQAHVFGEWPPLAFADTQMRARSSTKAVMPICQRLGIFRHSQETGSQECVRNNAGQIPCADAFPHDGGSSWGR